MTNLLSVNDTNMWQWWGPNTPRLGPKIVPIFKFSNITAYEYPMVVYNGISIGLYKLYELTFRQKYQTQTMVGPTNPSFFAQIGHELQMVY